MGRRRSAGQSHHEPDRRVGAGRKHSGLCYRSYSPACGDKSTGWISSNTWKAHFWDVTGAHSMKVGYNGLWNYDSQESNPAPPDAVQYPFNNWIPNQITEFSGVFGSEWRTRFDAVFVQDQWTLNRLTLQGGLRYDHAWSYYPNARIGGTRFFPTVTTIDKADGVNFHNISPRVGAAYDLFGTGRTSWKANWGRTSTPRRTAAFSLAPRRHRRSQPAPIGVGPTRIETSLLIAIS